MHCIYDNQCSVKNCNTQRNCLGVCVGCFHGYLDGAAWPDMYLLGDIAETIPLADCSMLDNVVLRNIEPRIPPMAIISLIKVQYRLHLHMHVVRYVGYFL